MEKYEQLSVVGEGSYGVVMKCRHKETGQLVAIKKFLETEEDLTVRKMALREIRMLKRLRHDNLVNMIEVFRRRRRFYLVFEYLDHTLLDELESNGGGLPSDTARKYIFQIVRGIEYCHLSSVIHRDIKPENVLVSKSGIVKLCDFGFARILAQPGELYTEYVATRWYRAPELLVGDPRYGPEVDIWAIGCLFVEMLTGDPIFPGESEIDQLSLIVKMVGDLPARHSAAWRRGPGASVPDELDPIADPYRMDSQQPHTSASTVPPLGNALREARAGDEAARALIVSCLQPEPMSRPTACELLRHRYFTRDNFSEGFVVELRKKISKELQAMPLLRKDGHIRSGHNDNKTSTNRARRDVPYHEMPSRWTTSFKLNSKSQKQGIEPMDTSNLSMSSATMKRPKIQTTNISVGDEINCLKHSSDPLSIHTSRSKQNNDEKPRTMSGTESNSSPTPFQSLQPPKNTTASTNLIPLQFLSNRHMKSVKNETGAYKTVKKSGILNLSETFIVQNRSNTKRKDNFTLPNVPGAVSSPVKGKFKLQPLGNHNINFKDGNDVSRSGNLPFM